MLRAAVERQIDNWREVLQGPHLNESRMILQQLVGPIVVLARTHDDDLPAEYLPDGAAFTVCRTATVNPAGLLDAADHNRMASLMRASWNQIARWLKQIEALRHAA